MGLLVTETPPCGADVAVHISTQSRYHPDLPQERERPPSNSEAATGESWQRTQVGPRGSSGTMLGLHPMPVQQKGTARPTKSHESRSSDTMPRILLVCPVHNSFMVPAQPCTVAQRAGEGPFVGVSPVWADHSPKHLSHPPRRTPQLALDSVLEVPDSQSMSPLCVSGSRKGKQF